MAFLSSAALAAAQAANNLFPAKLTDVAGDQTTAPAPNYGSKVSWLNGSRAPAQQEQVIPQDFASRASEAQAKNPNGYRSALISALRTRANSAPASQGGNLNYFDPVADANAGKAAQRTFKFIPSSLGQVSPFMDDVQTPMSQSLIDSLRGNPSNFTSAFDRIGRFF